MDDPAEEEAYFAHLGTARKGNVPHKLKLSRKSSDFVEAYAEEYDCDESAS